MNDDTKKKIDIYEKPKQVDSKGNGKAHMFNLAELLEAKTLLLNSAYLHLQTETDESKRMQYNNQISMLKDQLEDIKQSFKLLVAETNELFDFNMEPDSKGCRWLEGYGSIAYKLAINPDFFIELLDYNAKFLETINNNNNNNNNVTKSITVNLNKIQIVRGSHGEPLKFLNLAEYLIEIHQCNLLDILLDQDKSQVVSLKDTFIHKLKGIDQTIAAKIEGRVNEEVERKKATDVLKAYDDGMQRRMSLMKKFISDTQNNNDIQFRFAPLTSPTSAARQANQQTATPIPSKSKQKTTIKEPKKAAGSSVTTKTNQSQPAEKKPKTPAELFEEALIKAKFTVKIEDDVISFSGTYDNINKLMAIIQSYKKNYTVTVAGILKSKNMSLDNLSSDHTHGCKLSAQKATVLSSFIKDNSSRLVQDISSKFPAQAQSVNDTKSATVSSSDTQTTVSSSGQQNRVDEASNSEMQLKEGNEEEQGGENEEDENETGLNPNQIEAWRDRLSKAFGRAIKPADINYNPVKKCFTLSLPSDIWSVTDVKNRHINGKFRIKDYDKICAAALEALKRIDIKVEKDPVNSKQLHIYHDKNADLPKPKPFIWKLLHKNDVAEIVLKDPDEEKESKPDVDSQPTQDDINNNAIQSKLPANTSRIYFADELIVKVAQARVADLPLTPENKKKKNKKTFCDLVYQCPSQGRIGPLHVEVFFDALIKILVKDGWVIEKLPNSTQPDKIILRIKLIGKHLSETDLKALQAEFAQKYDSLVEAEDLRKQAEFKRAERENTIETLPAEVRLANDPVWVIPVSDSNNNNNNNNSAKSELAPDIQKINLQYHLDELKEIPQEFNNHIYFLVYTFHIMRVFEITKSDHTLLGDNLCNRWRNIIRHLFTELEWSELYRDINKFVVRLRLSMNKKTNSNSFFGNDHENQLLACRELHAALTKFEAKLPVSPAKPNEESQEEEKRKAEMRKEKDDKLGVFFHNLQRDIRDLQLPEKWQRVATLMLYSLIGEGQKPQWMSWKSYRVCKDIFIEIGHTTDKQDQVKRELSKDLLDRLYNKAIGLGAPHNYAQVLQNLPPPPHKEFRK